MRRWTRTLAAAAAAIAAMGAGPAAAQDTSLGALIDRLDRLERDIGAVQRRLAREGVPAEALAGNAADGDLSTAAARQEVRLSQLEEQIRRLTGQVEEAQYQARRAAEALDRMNTDVDMRLTQIERRLDAGGRPGAAAVAGTGPRPAPGPGPEADETRPPGLPGAPGTTTVVESTGTSVLPDPNAERFETMGVLGTVGANGGGAGQDAANPGTDTGAPETRTAAADPAPATPEGEYQAAYGLLAQADYAGAGDAFESFIARHPENALTGNAYYWLGETYYVRNDYQNAAVSFARGYKNFPDGQKALDNLLKLGMSFTAMNKTPEACATFDKLTRDHGDAPKQVLDRVKRERERAGCA